MGAIKSKIGTIGSKMGRKFEQKRKAKWVKKSKFGQGLFRTFCNSWKSGLYTHTVLVVVVGLYTF